MYGYLNYRKVKRVDKIYEMYRCYYCGLCHALKRHYGTIATMFLSYDLVFAAIALSQGISQTDTRPACCVYKRRCKLGEEYDSDYWRHMANVSVALIYSKLLDDSYDNSDLLSKIKLKAFMLWSRGARKNASKLFEGLGRSARLIADAEHRKDGYYVQSALTASMLSDAFCDYDIDCDDATKEFLHIVAEWLCFVDALDDYERDRKRKKYNPLIMLWNSNDAYSHDIGGLFTAKYADVAHIYGDIAVRMRASLKKMRTAGNEKEFLYEMVNRVMPERVSKLIKRC